MKLSSKLMLGTQCILIAAILLFGGLIVNNAKNVMTTEAVSYVLTEEKALNMLINNMQPKLASYEDHQLARTALNYTIKTESLPSNIEYVLMSEDDIIYNESGVNVAQIMQTKKTNSVLAIDKEPINWIIIDQGQKSFCIAARSIHFWIDNTKEYWQAAVFDITQNMQGIHRLVQSSLLIGAVVMAIVFLLEQLLIRRILSPLESLTDSAAQISGGNYEKRIAVSNRKDELGTLAVRFNEMAEAVQNQMNELREERDQQKLLLRAMAHEMRTPITAISGYAFALQSARLTEDQKHEALVSLQRQSLRLSGLSESLNNLIRMELSVQLVESSPDKLRQLLEQTITPVASQKKITLHFAWSNQPLLADESLLLSLLCNLFDNAAKAGATYIEIGYDGDSFWLSDNGCGMAQEEIQNVTRPFYQIDRSRKKEGFGLGLALCERIAKAHGAVLTIESKLGKGTKIIVRLAAEQDKKSSYK